ncbi:MAG: radical SAM protein [Elusimicrobia bacterium]|nr:radical SAM protein [Elusimicrobiota bacterium]
MSRPAAVSLDVQLATPWLGRLPADPSLASLVNWFERTLYLDVGHRCDQHCRYCFQDKAGARFLSLGELEGSLSAARGLKLRRAILIGGEPAIHPDLEGIVRSLSRAGIGEWGMMSNGFELGQGRRLDRLADLGLGFCQLSLDSPHPSIQNFLCRNPRLFPRLAATLAGFNRHPGVVLALNAVVTRLNAGHLVALVRYVDSMRSKTGIRPSLILTHAKPHDAMPANLMVRASEAAQAVRLALEEGRRLRLPVLFRNLPFCLLDGWERWSTDWFTVLRRMDSKGAARPQHDAEARKAAVCGSCRHFETCPGFLSRYAERYGEAEFRPKERRSSTGPAGADAGLGEGPSVSLLLGTRCNLRCPFCYVTERGLGVSLRQTMAMVERLLASGWRRFLLAGGEPTLFPGTAEVAAKITSAGGSAVLVTNGVKLADRELCRRLKAAGVSRAMLSLHANRSEVFARISGSAEALPLVLQGFSNLVAEGVAVDVHHVLSAENYRFFPEFVRFYAARLRRLGLTSLSVSNLILVNPRLSRRKAAVPRLSEVRPFLEEGARWAREMGFEVCRGASEDAFPECVFGPAGNAGARRPDQRWFAPPTSGRPGLIFAGPRVGLKDVRSFGARDYNAVFAHGRPCRVCARKDACLGIQSDYARLHGWSEIKAVA